MQRKDHQRIFISPQHDCAELREIVKGFYPDAQIMGQCPRATTELTPIGEQYVIPGCEKHERPKGDQLKLWER